MLQESVPSLNDTFVSLLKETAKGRDRNKVASAPWSGGQPSRLWLAHFCKDVFWTVYSSLLFQLLKWMCRPFHLLPLFLTIYSLQSDVAVLNILHCLFAPLKSKKQFHLRTHVNCLMWKFPFLFQFRGIIFTSAYLHWALCFVRHCVRLWDYSHQLRVVLSLKSSPFYREGRHLSTCEIQWWRHEHRHMPDTVVAQSQK